MASITREKNGRRSVQFVLDKKRHTIRLGKITQKGAESFKLRLEYLLAARLAGHALDAETAEWLGGLDSKLTGCLVRVGLVEPRQSARLAEFIDSYIAGRHDTKRSTKTVMGHTRRNLVEFFGADRPLRSITPGDADDWRRHLVQCELSENTIRRRSGIAKQFFTAAQRKRLVDSNAFSDLTASVMPVRKRDYFVSLEEAARVLDACPDAQWRLLFVLSRFGGLRCPSEHLALQWQDVDWERNRITIRSPKTEHHVGHDSRVIPLFPELRPFLEAVWEQAEPGTVYVITRYRRANANLRTQFEKIISRAGLKPWPKLFQNLRATRQTELEETYASHVVCKWIGNSRQVAERHYLQVTDEHFHRAIGSSDRLEALQNALQQAAASDSTNAKPESSTNRKRPVLQGGATTCDSVQVNTVGDAGLEPATPCL